MRQRLPTPILYEARYVDVWNAVASLASEHGPRTNSGVRAVNKNLNDWVWDIRVESGPTLRYIFPTLADRSS
ncbi:hypothetical protein PUNSTDRAFT_122437 [Punctularia strigosozonata HHB-11173 SS5]|uniref:uncharacterized protein n=1 Tax=Punctularia strigosozonata (strain HHB-11173) TaxID=741275 RepID=UPI000441633F|nr:uncharacterized protein PUNSTDRAFT_122437 [Punctularia strigosozonata HHB-11173 SS5]EIN05610.1 hypothetical protein PUNSTDRAFT_122437 [Punctularia strigosozonata HHB-11173 SS5]